MFYKGDMHIIKDMRNFLHESVPITDILELNIGFSEGTFLNILKDYHSLLKEILKNISDICKGDLTWWHWMDGHNRHVFMLALSARQNHPMNPVSPFHMENVEASRKKWRRIDGDVRHWHL